MHKKGEEVTTLATRSFLNFLFGFLGLIALAFVAITVTSTYSEEGVPPTDLAAPADSTS